MQKRILTPEGLEKLEKELKQLKTVDRPAVIKRIADARELGDLSENADYHDAREQQSFIEGRIKDIEEMIRNSDVVASRGDKGIVQLGSQVVVEVGGSKVNYEIVGSNEADPLEGKISLESPVGSALMDRKAGDKVIAETPNGGVEYKVVEVK